MVRNPRYLAQSFYNDKFCKSKLIVFLIFNSFLEYLFSHQVIIVYKLSFTPNQQQLSKIHYIAVRLQNTLRAFLQAFRKFIIPVILLFLQTTSEFVSQQVFLSCLWKWQFWRLSLLTFDFVRSCHLISDVLNQQPPKLHVKLAKRLP